MVRPAAMMTTLHPTEAQELAARLATVRSWVLTQADDGRPLAATVDAMAFVHLGLSALVSFSSSSSPSTMRTYWRGMRDRLRSDFPGYTRQAPGTGAARLRLALLLDRCHTLVPAVHTYTSLARATGRDTRW